MALAYRAFKPYRSRGGLWVEVAMVRRRTVVRRAAAVLDNMMIVGGVDVYVVMALFGWQHD